MAERSKRINLYDPEKAKQINPETLKLFQKYQVDMSIRDLSPNSVYGYNTDLMFLKQLMKILKNIIIGENNKETM